MASHTRNFQRSTHMIMWSSSQKSLSKVKRKLISSHYFLNLSWPWYCEFPEDICSPHVFLFGKNKGPPEKALKHYEHCQNSEKMPCQSALTESEGTEIILEIISVNSMQCHQVQTKLNRGPKDRFFNTQLWDLKLGWMIIMVSVCLLVCSMYRIWDWGLEHCIHMT